MTPDKFKAWLEGVGEPTAPPLLIERVKRAHAAELDAWRLVEGRAEHWGPSATNPSEVIPITGEDPSKAFEDLRQDKAARAVLTALGLPLDQ